MSYFFAEYSVWSAAPHKIIHSANKRLKYSVYSSMFFDESLNQIRIESTMSENINSSDNPTIFHNPRCSKSRAAMELLNDKGIEANVVKYLETPPSRDEIVTVLNLLNLEPRELMRKGEAEYRENNLADEALTREQLIDALVEFPKLIERPIVIANGKAAIGRPIENIIEIL